VRLTTSHLKKLSFLRNPKEALLGGDFQGKPGHLQSCRADYDDELRVSIIIIYFNFNLDEIYHSGTLSVFES
jgi:hypothetical protein